MIVPIWSASWEISCCQPEATIGQTWRVPLSVDIRDQPWWPSDTSDTSIEQIGRVSLDIKRLTSRSDPHPTFSAGGSLRFRGADDLMDGVHLCRLNVDAHPTDERFPIGQVTSGGTVVRVDLVPLRFELVERQSYQPVAQLPPISVTSTVSRRDVDEEPHGDSFVSCELLVWVELDD